MRIKPLKRVLVICGIWFCI